MKRLRDKFTDYCLERLPTGLVVAAVYFFVILLMVHYG